MCCYIFLYIQNIFGYMSYYIDNFVSFEDLYF
jgi:hypothetical protein